MPAQGRIGTEDNGSVTAEAMERARAVTVYAVKKSEGKIVFGLVRFPPPLR